MRGLAVFLTMLSLFFSVAGGARAEKITVAAAADLKFAMDEIVEAFLVSHANDEVEVVYGSSGKFKTQILQGAPYDLYFSADIGFPRELASKGYAASEVMPYAFGRIVIWSRIADASKLSLRDLVDPQFTKIAIANPEHAPYGRRAKEALEAEGYWKAIEPRLVYGENISHTAQFVQTGNAQVGIIALSLALAPTLSAEGSYALIPDTLHEPLEQGFIVTKRAQGSALARDFAEFMSSHAARTVMTKYGFNLPQRAAAQ